MILRAVFSIWVLLVMPASSIEAQVQDRPETHLGWELSAHTYSFRTYTVAESLERAQSIGLDAVEIYPDQKIGSGISGSFTHHMDADSRSAIRELLAEYGIRLVAFGVIVGQDLEDWRRIYAFSKEMGISYLVVEPDHTLLPEIGQLATEFEIKTAIHNHPAPSYYWSPEIVLESIQAANSPFVGACADVGHWIRSGRDPIASLRTLEGHVLSLHFKDLEKQEGNIRDVVWGQGAIDIPGVVAELIRQGFQGNISAEYEDDPRANLQPLKESIRYFRELLTEAIGSEKKKD